MGRKKYKAGEKGVKPKYCLKRKKINMFKIWPEYRAQGKIVEDELER